MSDETHSDGKDEDDGLLAAEYLLGVLPPDEHERVRARLRAEPALRAELGLWQARLAGLDADFAETPAPAGVWARIDQRLFTAAARPGLWHSLAFWRAASAGALAVAALAVALYLTTPRPDPEAFAAQLVAALHQEGSDVSFVALYNGVTHELRLTALSGAAVPDRDYELWAIEGAAAPRSMGLVAVTDSNALTVPADILVDFGAGTVLAVTLEQKGGSPSGDPQGPVVAAGAATPI